jgi:16S rRNA processing protein RimM
VFAKANTERGQDEVRIGRVGRLHGKEGAFVVLDPTERLTLLDPGRTVTIGEREMTVAWRRGTAERPLVKLEGADGRDLRGEAITVPRAALGALPEGEFLVDDLVGCDVFDGPRRLGRVRDVLLLPSVDVLEVEADEQPLLVPLVADAVRMVDVDGSRIDVDSAFVEHGH